MPINKKHPAHHNQVRIIGGDCRGRKLSFPEADGLRPTAGSVRERLFNWLGQDLTGCHVLDLFAGSGALGLEAASRHAESVVMVESNQRVLSALKNNIRQLQFNHIDLIYMDAMQYLRTAAGQFDVIFLDPPYAWQNWPELMAAIEPHLKEQARIYLEARQLPELPEVWRIDKRGKSGISQFALLSHQSR